MAEKTSHSVSASPFKSDSGSEAIHLKKIDAPTFTGREEDCPEFYRKWVAIVGPAKLPEEAEVDRLRDALPEEAKDMLVGVSKIATAWDILKKRYRDEDLIKVRSIVSRLNLLKASKALKYDGEFVASVYFQLLDRHK